MAQFPLPLDFYSVPSTSQKNLNNHLAIYNHLDLVFRPVQILGQSARCFTGLSPAVGVTKARLPPRVPACILELKVA